MRRRHLTMLLAPAAIWGASLIFIKVAVRELEPGVVVFAGVALGTGSLRLRRRVPVAEAP